MKKEMLINVKQPEECRIAIVEDGVLEELYVERTSHESYTGNIYKGRIVNLEPAIQAAFVDFSVGRNGFLHVSDVESQYFDRGPAGPADTDAGPRDRDRRRDPRREGDRNRGRDPRRRPPAPDAADPSFGPPPNDPPRLEPPRLEPPRLEPPRLEPPRLEPPRLEPPRLEPPRIEDRYSERPRDPQRDPQRDRDRNRDRPRERERPDQSVRGRRDRSEPPPRRFGEGLVSQPEPWPEPEPPLDPVSPQSEPLFEQKVTEPAREAAEPVTTSRPETQGDWAADRFAEEPGGKRLPGWPPAARSEPEPFGTQLSEAELSARELLEPFDPDLPPSRTQRKAPPARPAEPFGSEWGRFQTETPHTEIPDETAWPERRTGDVENEPPGGRGGRRGARPRGRAPVPPPRSQPEDFPSEREPSSTVDLPPGFEPDFEARGLDRGEAPPSDQPPRRRGGRAAIRARGGDPDRPRDSHPLAEPGATRPARGQLTPGESESDRGRVATPERYAEPERRRSPEPSRDRDRDRMPPHSRAGEPGYVPRRERLRSGDSAFGSDIFPPDSEWPERDVEPQVPGEARARTSDAPDDDLGFGPGAAPAGPSGEGKTDPRRRRRRGRRRERERPGHEPAPASPVEDLAPAFEELSSNVDSPWSFDRARGAGPETLDDLDDFEPGAARRPRRARLDDEIFESGEPARERPSAADEEIDAELEQEIQREIDEIAELEREMGLRGPAEARGRRGDEPSRGGRSVRGRGLAKPPIQEIFRRGDEVLVQVIKESIGTKGPTLSTYISIPGRYLVLMPGLNRVGVSRKIVDEGQRRKLREIMNELNPPKGLGFIVRTAGLERTKRELARDLAYLLRLWKVILRRIKKSKAPTPIYQESDMIIRTIRDIFNSEIDTIWIDEPSAFERAHDFLKVVMPRFASRLKLYDEKVPLFHKYGIEDEIAKIQRRHVPLPEGGSIVIDQTEALVAIDVNSGNFRVEDDAERTAYEMNLRAAKEIARQLRLRDLGGVIVNDFIDMREERHCRGVERALRDAIKRDRARTKILRMSAFGLIEMTRQRIRPSLKRSIYEDCPHCGGAGVAKTAESMAIDVTRLLALASHREEIRKIVVSVHPHVATYLGNRKRQQIAKLEAESNLTIQIGFAEDSPAEHLKIECYDANGNEVRPFPTSPQSHKRAAH